MMTEVTQQQFKSTVLDSNLPVLVDFWADWCGPCRMLAPTLDKLEQEVSGQATICKVNIDEQKELAVQFDVTSIPTLLVFKNGQIVERRSGVMNIKQLKQMIGLT
ncbi:MAG: thioredoxin [Clostridiales bacterium]|jgi:thioredoxin 1|nr:thioredoxin [Clostridiales bacterium]